MPAQAETPLERELLATAASLERISFHESAALMRRAAQELARQRRLEGLRARPTPMGFEPAVIGPGKYPREPKPLTMAEIERVVLGPKPADSEPRLVPVSKAERAAMAPKRNQGPF